MNILITGIAGFIGQHAGGMLATSNKVFGVKRVSTSLNAIPAVELISADLSDPDFVDHLPAGIDCVIHLAQSQQYRNFPEGVDDMRRINIDATCQLLDWARKAGVKKFIFASTANVYGKSSEQLTESHSTQPETFYGATKLAAEYLVKQYQGYYQVDILRLFTVYGPGQKGMLIPNIADRIKRGQPVILADSIGLYITPVYVGDVVSVIEKLVKSPRASTFRVLNVCGDEVTSLSEIVKILEKALNTKACIQLSDQPIQYFAGKNDALKASLSLKLMTDLDAGMIQTFKGANLLN